MPGGHAKAQRPHCIYQVAPKSTGTGRKTVLIVKLNKVHHDVPLLSESTYSDDAHQWPPSLAGSEAIVVGTFNWRSDCKLRKVFWLP